MMWLPSSTVRLTTSARASGDRCLGLTQSWKPCTFVIMRTRRPPTTHLRAARHNARGSQPIVVKSECSWLKSDAELQALRLYSGRERASILSCISTQTDTTLSRTPSATA